MVNVDEISIRDVDLVKSLHIPIGTIKEWQNGLYQKIDEGKWVKYTPVYPKGYKHSLKRAQIFTKSEKLTKSEIQNLKVGEQYLLRPVEGFEEFIKVKYVGFHNTNFHFINENNFLFTLTQNDLETDALRKVSEHDKVLPIQTYQPKPLVEEEKAILDQIERGSIVIVNRGNYNAKAVYIDQTNNFEFKPIAGHPYDENDVEVRLGGSKHTTTVKVLDIINVETKNIDKLYKIFTPGYEFQMNFILGKATPKDEIHHKFKVGQSIASGVKGFSSEHMVKFTNYYPHLFLAQSMDSEGRKFYNLTKDVNLYSTEDIFNINQLRNKELNPFGEEQLHKVLKPLVNYQIQQLPIKNKDLFLNNFVFYKNELKFDVSNPFVSEELDEKGKLKNKDRANEAKVQDFVMELEEKGFPFKGRYNTADGKAKITFDISIK